MPVGHGRNDSFLIGEIPVDQPNANAGFAADVVHTGLVKAALGEANQGRINDLGAAI